MALVPSSVHIDSGCDPPLTLRVDIQAHQLDENGAGPSKQKRRLRQYQSEACRVLHGESNDYTSSDSKKINCRVWNRESNTTFHMPQQAENRSPGPPISAQLCGESDSESNTIVKGNPCTSRHYGTPLERQLC